MTFWIFWTLSFVVVTAALFGLGYLCGYKRARLTPTEHDRYFYAEIDRTRAMLLSVLPEWTSDRTLDSLAWMVVQRLGPNPGREIKRQP